MYRKTAATEKLVSRASSHCIAMKFFMSWSVECHSQWSNYEIRRHRVCSTSYFWNFWLENVSNLTVVYRSTVIYEWIFSATSSLLPYLTIHMQSIGITVEEIAIIYLALPFTTFLAPPITGTFLFFRLQNIKNAPVIFLVPWWHHVSIWKVTEKY